MSSGKMMEKSVHGDERAWFISNPIYLELDDEA